MKANTNLVRVQTFQFHKGAIETCVPSPGVVCSTSFNSIKVRLKLGAKRLLYQLGYFQFHKGAIETDTHVVDVTISPAFNSIKVRLKRHFLPTLYLNTPLSIP